MVLTDSDDDDDYDDFEDDEDNCDGDASDRDASINASARSKRPRTASNALTNHRASSSDDSVHLLPPLSSLRQKEHQQQQRHGPALPLPAADAVTYCATASAAALTNYSDSRTSSSTSNAVNDADCYSPGSHPFALTSWSSLCARVLRWDRPDCVLRACIDREAGLYPQPYFPCNNNDKNTGVNNTKANTATNNFSSINITNSHRDSNSVSASREPVTLLLPSFKTQTPSLLLPFAPLPGSPLPPPAHALLPPPLRHLANCLWTLDSVLLDSLMTHAARAATPLSVLKKDAARRLRHDVSAEDLLRLLTVMPESYEVTVVTASPVPTHMSAVANSNAQTNADDSSNKSNVSGNDDDRVFSRFNPDTGLSTLLRCKYLPPDHEIKISPWLPPRSRQQSHRPSASDPADATATANASASAESDVAESVVGVAPLSPSHLWSYLSASRHARYALLVRRLLYLSLLAQLAPLRALSLAFDSNNNKNNGDFMFSAASIKDSEFPFVVASDWDAPLTGTKFSARAVTVARALAGHCVSALTTLAPTLHGPSHAHFHIGENSHNNTGAVNTQGDSELGVAYSAADANNCVFMHTHARVLATVTLNASNRHVANSKASSLRNVQSCVFSGAAHLPASATATASAVARTPAAAAVLLREARALSQLWTALPAPAPPLQLSVRAPWPVWLPESHYVVAPSLMQDKTGLLLPLPPLEAPPPPPVSKGAAFKRALVTGAAVSAGEDNDKRHGDGGNAGDDNSDSACESDGDNDGVAADACDCGREQQLGSGCEQCSYRRRAHSHLLRTKSSRLRLCRRAALPPAPPAPPIAFVLSLAADCTHPTELSATGLRVTATAAAAAGASALAVAEGESGAAGAARAAAVEAAAVDAVLGPETVSSIANETTLELDLELNKNSHDQRHSATKTLLSESGVGHDSGVSTSNVSGVAMTVAAGASGVSAKGVGVRVAGYFALLTALEQQLPQSSGAKTKSAKTQNRSIAVPRPMLLPVHAYLYLAPKDVTVATAAALMQLSEQQSPHSNGNNKTHDASETVSQKRKSLFSVLSAVCVMNNLALARTAFTASHNSNIDSVNSNITAQQPLFIHASGFFGPVARHFARLIATLLHPTRGLMRSTFLPTRPDLSAGRGGWDCCAMLRALVARVMPGEVQDLWSDAAKSANTPTKLTKNVDSRGDLSGSNGDCHEGNRFVILLTKAALRDAVTALRTNSALKQLEKTIALLSAVTDAAEIVRGMALTQSPAFFTTTSNNSNANADASNNNGQQPQVQTATTTAAGGAAAGAAGGLAALRARLASFKNNNNAAAATSSVAATAPSQQKPEHQQQQQQQQSGAAAAAAVAHRPVPLPLSRVVAELANSDRIGRTHGMSPAACEKLVVAICAVSAAAAAIEHADAAAKSAIFTDADNANSNDGAVATAKSDQTKSVVSTQRSQAAMQCVTTSFGTALRYYPLHNASAFAAAAAAARTAGLGLHKAVAASVAAVAEAASWWTDPPTVTYSGTGSDANNNTAEQKVDTARLESESGENAGVELRSAGYIDAIANAATAAEAVAATQWALPKYLRQSKSPCQVNVGGEVTVSSEWDRVFVAPLRFLLRKASPLGACLDSALSVADSDGTAQTCPDSATAGIDPVAWPATAAGRLLCFAHADATVERVARASVATVRRDGRAVQKLLNEAKHAAAPAPQLQPSVEAVARLQREQRERKRLLQRLNLFAGCSRGRLYFYPPNAPGVPQCLSSKTNSSTASATDANDSEADDDTDFDVGLSFDSDAGTDREHETGDCERLQDVEGALFARWVARRTPALPQTQALIQSLSRGMYTAALPSLPSLASLSEAIPATHALKNSCNLPCALELTQNTPNSSPSARTPDSTSLSVTDVSTPRVSLDTATAVALLGDSAHGTAAAVAAANADAAAAVLLWLLQCTAVESGCVAKRLQ